MGEKNDMEEEQKDMKEENYMKEEDMEEVEKQKRN